MKLKAMVLEKQSEIEKEPLKYSDLEKPTPREDEVLIEIEACGVCRTDLHVIEGDLPPRKLPLIPGHQIVGKVKEAGGSLEEYLGKRVGLPWLYWTCRSCKFCARGEENLCEKAEFTGYTVDGGYSEYVLAKKDFFYELPEDLNPEEMAPWLCGGVIGYRAFKLSGASEGEKLGLYGFGSSAHMIIQVSTHLGIENYVFTRGEKHRELAERLGAKWTGFPTDRPPEKLDAAIIFAPAGELVIEALKNLDKGGRLVLAGIHMTNIPEMRYSLIYDERSIKSVANSTRGDVKEFISLAREIPIKTRTETFKLREANEALIKLKKGEISGTAVLKI